MNVCINQILTTKFARNIELDQAMFQAVKNFIKLERKVPSEVSDAMRIKKIFSPAMESWSTLYIQFAEESSVKTLYRYTHQPWV